MNDAPPKLRGERKKLYEEAILLSRFFLHHPSSQADEKVDALEIAIGAVDSAADLNAQDSAYDVMRLAYRALLRETYPAYQVSGRSIRDSNGTILSLVALPITLFVLLLFIQPVLFLLRYLAPDFVAAEMAADVTFYLGFIIAFIWGAAGGLFHRSLRIISAVHRKRYNRCHHRGAGVIASISGLLGLVMWWAADFTKLPAGMITDIAVGSGAFIAGFCWSLIFSWISNAPVSNPKSQPLS